MITYSWPGFRLTHDPETGETYTRFVNGRTSGCRPVPGDEHHAPALGITPAQHRLAHELAHHLIGVRFYRSRHGSPVVYRDAHQIPQAGGGWVKIGWSEADREEYLSTAITYLACGQQPRPDEDGAVEMLRREGLDPDHLARELRWLMDAADHAPVIVQMLNPQPLRVA